MKGERHSQSTSIDNLVVSIARAFPVEPRLPQHVSLAYARGDSWSFQKIIDILNYRPWDAVTFKEFVDCGADELKNYLTEQAYLYYLPGLLTCILRTLKATHRTRLHEVSILMLLPTAPEYKDVWASYGDGLFSEWGTPYFSEPEKALMKKINFVHASLTYEQRNCVAQYVDILGADDTQNPDVEAIKLLRKFSNYWRTPSPDNSR